MREELKPTSMNQPWRFAAASLDAAALDELAEREFPNGQWEQLDAVSRRKFLAIMGASLALAGAAGCRQPAEEIVPYARSQPLEPGKPLFFATAMPLAGAATGLLVEQHLGRPTKIEGNPDHPASLGATDAFAQAAILTLYDPERSRQVVYRGEPSDWEGAIAALRRAIDEQRSSGGAGLRLLTESISSPTLIGEIELLLEDLPEAQWIEFEPFDRSAVYRGTEPAFGRRLTPIYDLQAADVILSLDSDLLASGPGWLRYSRQFADRRRVWKGPPAKARMNRLYAAGPTPSPTSASADHWLPLRGAECGNLLRAIAAELDVPLGARPADMGSQNKQWTTAVVADLKASAGRSLVVVGDSQPAEVHALAHAINDLLENIGQTVRYIRPINSRAEGQVASLTAFADDIANDRVQVSIILGGNPAFTAAADLDFQQLLLKVPQSFHLGLYRDETARLCQWHLPEAHFLESWGDARAFDGTASLIQPLISPLAGGKSALELVASLRGRTNINAYDIVREFWRDQWQAAAEHFEGKWSLALHDGVIAESAFAAEHVELRDNWWEIDEPSPSPPTADAGDLEIVFLPDPTIHDGRFANNAWLQELPKPLTKLTWDAIAAFSPATAERLGIKLEIGSIGGDMLADEVRLEFGGRTAVAPAWILPGQADDCVSVFCGYGRDAAGTVGSGVGFNGYAIRTSDQPWFGRGLRVERTGRKWQLAATQLHHVMSDENLVRAGTISEYQRDPQSLARRQRPPQGRSLPIVNSRDDTASKPAAERSLYEPHKYDGYKWGMVIDQTACIGCMTCVVACQAENNIPVVGKEEVCRGRELHWLRVDTYHDGDPGRPAATYSQPVPCMHCENAPCEVVCPVYATVHSDEGLNDMVYNRCVGTRYCSNNCPYKVRRFNFFQYADWETESLKALRNPDVSVRSRGVMEKCTYCVQRINTARSNAEQDDRPLVQNRAGEWVKPIYEGELLTACQAACPTQAIVFGDLNDAESQVSKLRYDQPLNYGLLNEELHTEPRTTYLATVRNPNPALMS